MKVNKIITAMIACPIVLSQAYAAQISDVVVSKSSDNKSVTVSGKIVNDGDKAESVIVKIVNPGATDKTPADGGLLAVEQIELEAGATDFKTTMGLKSDIEEGRYYIYLSGNGLDEPNEPSELWYYTDETLDTKAQEIVNGVTSASALETALFEKMDIYTEIDGDGLHSNADILSLKVAYYDESLNGEISKIVYAAISDIDDYDDLREAFQIATVMAALNTGKTDKLLNSNGVLADSIFSEDDKDLALLEKCFNGESDNTTYGGLTKKGRENTISFLSGNGWTDIDEFKTKFADQVVYDAIYNNSLSGYGYIPEILDTFKNIVSYNTSKFLSLSSKNQMSKAYDISNAGAKDTEELSDILDGIKVSTSSSGGVTGNAVTSGNKNTSVSGIEKDYANDLKAESEKKEEEWLAGFSDLDGFEWAKEAINELSATGIINGVGDKMFSPERNVTRAEFAKMLVNTMGYEITSGATEFTDVADDVWYAPYINALKNNGITNGSGDGKFNPDAEISRQEACTFMYRALGSAESTTDLTYTDKDAISEYAKTAVATMTESGIVNGYEDGSFRPENSTTRAEATVMFYRLMGGIK